MPLIAAQKERKDGGYSRLFGDEELGLLLSKVQAAVISSGTELEKLITRTLAAQERLVQDVDYFLQNAVGKRGVFVATKNL